MTTGELHRVMQQIQVADYQLHATFRILAHDAIDPDHIEAFIDASLRRDRLMDCVLSYLAELRKQKALAAPNRRNDSRQLPQL
ncbi:MAG TPA: hypothetical protein VJ728_03880 [Candidatus Binataceae bacterium]|nr:hypothetical protein [Candidatus Binataceae bacterium]